MNPSHEAGAMLSGCESMCVYVCVCGGEKMRGKVNGGKDGVKETGWPDLHPLFVCLVCACVCFCVPCVTLCWF